MKDNFRIENLKIEDGEDCYRITVEWFSTDPDLGQLGRYTRAIHVTNKTALEEFEENEYEKPLKDVWDFKPCDDGTNELILKIPSSFDMGLEKFVDIRGADVVKEVSTNRYKYDQYISKCMIVEACIQQLHQMKDQIDNAYNKPTDFSKQAGAFRSGDPYHDFLGVVETLDRFWD